MKRVLVTGGSGFVGWRILQRAGSWADLSLTYFNHEVEYPLAEAHQLDISDNEVVLQTIADINPDIVIHAAAMTDVDGCEENPETAWEVNVEGTRNVLEAAGKFNAKVVFISTSFVFDGSKNPYKVADSQNPINEYGRTKSEAEKLVLETDLETAIIRTDQPYGWSEPWQKPTMVEWTLTQLKKKDTLEVFTDWYNMPTYVRDLADAVLTISRNERIGIFHIVGPDYISRYEWAKVIGGLHGFKESNIKPIDSTSADLPAERPNVELEPTTENIETQMVGIKEGVNRFMGSEHGK